MTLATRTAQELWQRWGTRDPLELCDRLGIAVLSVQLPDSVRGFSFQVRDRRVICLGRELQRPLRRQVCAHELGHCLLHPEQNLLFLTQNTLQVSQRFEREADEFCAALLLDPAELADQPPVWQLAEDLGVEERIAGIMLEKVAPQLRREKGGNE